MTDLSPRPPGWTPDVSTFGARLALVRQRMGWGNVKQAADLCGTPVQSWRGWERDGLMPRSLITVCIKIAGVTGVDYRWLALGPDDRTVGDSERTASDTLRYRRHRRGRAAPGSAGVAGGDAHPAHRALSR